MLTRFLAVWVMGGLMLLAGVPRLASAGVGTLAGRQLVIRLQPGPTTGSERPLRAASVPGAPAPIRLPDGNILEPVRRLDDGSLVVRLPASLDSAQALEQLRGDPSVARAEVDVLLRPALVPNDTSYSDQWYLYEDTAGIRAPAAWDVTTGSSAITIAVLDSGILGHVDLDNTRILPGYDFITDATRANDGDGRDADPSDPGDAVVAGECGLGEPAEDSSWHGLSVTGVIAATSDNGTDIAGIDFGARILPVRVLGKCGGYTSDIADAIRWAAGLSVAGVPDNPNPAQVINLSLSGEGACGSVEQAAIDAAVAAGAVVVVAAGNEGGDVSRYNPANCANVIVAGAIDQDGSIASYTNRGVAVDLAAPGGDGSFNGAPGILTLWNSGATVPGTDILAFIQGTSFTAAQTSAVVSLMLAGNAALTATEVEDLLCATARSFPDASCDITRCGAGVLDASAAVASAAATATDPAVLSAAAGCGAAVKAAAAARLGTGGGGGGGGCTLVPVARRADLLLPALLLLSVFGLFRRRAGSG
ncbi:MAG TPA: peptidase S8 [Gammaproteobacteria bacterium]|nr:peptidase S8 [Gammaproteobacteria bacterium]